MRVGVKCGSWVMHEAQYLDHAVRCHTVNHQMPGLTNPIVSRHEAAHGPEMECSHPHDSGNVA
jgi:hypothetical protein